jgi:hypothetical protein
MSADDMLLKSRALAEAGKMPTDNTACFGRGWQDAYRQHSVLCQQLARCLQTTQRALPAVGYMPTGDMLLESSALSAVGYMPTGDMLLESSALPAVGYMPTGDMLLESSALSAVIYMPRGDMLMESSALSAVG